MSDSNARDDKVSYRLMERITDLLICSRCFRRNVRKPVTTLLSTRQRPMPVCAECSGKIKPGHSAKVVSIG